MSAVESNSPLATAAQELLAPLLDRPDRCAVLLDVDGTLAPIVARPGEASVPEPTRHLLSKLAGRGALVACVSGRRAEDARRVVGLPDLAYVGNHGLELLRPGAVVVEPLVELRHRRAVRTFAERAYTPELRAHGVRLEDKESIWSFHWREADDERWAREALDAVAAGAAGAGLVAHWGRKVLEIRPAADVDKGTAVERMLREAGLDAALYAGDDTTDLDAFRKLRQLRERGSLRHAICVGVASAEGPPEIAREADLVVEGPAGFADLLAALAG